MSGTRKEELIKVYHDPDGNKVHDYESYYVVFFSDGRRHFVLKSVVESLRSFVEEPDGTVMRDASFYALMGSPRGGHVKFVSSTPEIGIRSLDPDHNKWWPVGADYRVAQPLPANVGVRWKYDIMTAPPMAFAPYIAPMQVTDPAMLAQIPDVFTWTSIPLVSDRARAVLQAQFPDGSYFLATTITAADGTRTERDYFYWVQRHRFEFSSAKIDGEMEPRKSDVWDFDLPSGSYVQWQMIHNGALRAFLQNLPFWGFELKMQSPVFSRRCFHALKAARLTGLVECTAANFDKNSEALPYNWSDYPWEIIGHID